MLILVIDSAASSCGVCLWHDGEILATRREMMLRGQDARLVPMVIEAMGEAKIDFSQLDKIAVTKGPGSFTGVRVGLATAHGIGLAARRPVLGIDRFTAYRGLYPDQDGLLIVLDSKRAELFCRFYPGHLPCMMTEVEINDFIATHPGTKIVDDRTTSDRDIMPICALLAANSSGLDPEFSPKPFYLRAPDVTFPKAR